MKQTSAHISADADSQLSSDSAIIRQVRAIMPRVETPFWTSANEPIRVRYDTRYKAHNRPLQFNRHDSWELQYIRGGHGQYFIAGSLESFRQYSVLVICPNESHAFIPDSGSPVINKVLVQLDPKCVSARYSDKWARHLVLSKADAVDFEVILTLMTKELNRHLPERDAMLRSLLRMMGVLLHRSMRNSVTTSTMPPLVSQLVALVETRFAESWTVARICKHFGYSVNYLPKLFKQATGIGLKHYLQQRRILEAKQLLETYPELTVSAIAAQVGFPEVVTFYRAFKTIAGATPEIYRRFCQ